jgi:UDP-N-acetylmuramate--alanine ligase
MKLSDIKTAYLVGIKGTGMSAVAQILAVQGVTVSGSDTEEKFFTEDTLKKERIAYFENFLPEHITGSEDVVIYSTAYKPDTHPELLSAQEKGVPLLSYPEFLAMLVREKLSIAVCGSHGKTTTTAMLAHTLEMAGLDPSAIVGSRVINWGGGARGGRGIHFVFEADEYQNKLALYEPWSAILTNIDYDHPDFFPTPESYRETFRAFLAKLPPHGFLLVCGDDAEAVKTAKESGRRFVTYGFSVDSDYRIDPRPTTHDKQLFTVTQKEKIIGEFEIQLVGRHNVQNAGGVVAMCHLLKCDMEKVSEGLRTFEGTARRFEKVGESDGVLFFDDYAHHPAEILATLKGARAKYPHKRILAVFQPHTFSRTSALFEEFAQCFGSADKVYLLDIYASAREAVGEVTSEKLTERINRYNPGRAEYVGNIEDAVKALQKEMQKNDLVITIGAGDGWKVNEKLKMKN